MRAQVASKEREELLASVSQWVVYASGLQEELRQSEERASGLQGEVKRVWADLEGRDKQWRAYETSMEAQARPKNPKIPKPSQRGARALADVVGVSWSGARAPPTAPRPCFGWTARACSAAAAAGGAPFCVLPAAGADRLQAGSVSCCGEAVTLLATHSRVYQVAGRQTDALGGAGGPALNHHREADAQPGRSNDAGI